MDTEHHARIKKLFLEACEREPAEGAGFVEQACGDDAELRHEVESLFGFHVEGDAMTLGQRPGGGTLADRIPARIGPYRVVRRLGEGGMGVVYEVEQGEPIRRRAVNGPRYR